MLLKKLFHNVLSPKWHYYIWVLLFIRLILPIYPQSSVSIYNLAYPAAEKINLPTTSTISTPFKNNSPNKISDKAVVKTTTQINTSKGENNIRTTENKNYSFILTLLALTWLIGVSIITIYTIYINVLFSINFHKNYTILEDERITNILDKSKNVMNIKNTISIFSSNKIRTPSLYGFFHSKILVSAEHMQNLNDDEIRYIFLHELSHYKRKDIAINWIMALLQIIYFFNPFLWYAFYKTHEDCEISCDAAALAYVGQSEYKSYGNTIIKLIRLYSESNFIPVTAGISKNKSSYKRRIIMITNFKKTKWTGTVIAVILIASIGLIGLTGCKQASNDKSNTKTTSDVTPTVKTIDTNAKTPTESSYKSSKLNLNITFPSNWADKYAIKETDKGLFIYFKPTRKAVEDQGLFFCIQKKTPDLNESMYDSIAGKKELSVNGTSYFIGGPTDISFPDNDAEFPEFRKLQSEIPEIISSRIK